MKTVGEILKQARLAKNISLENVSRETKIHVKYLKAIEENNFTALPASAFTKGFIRNYALAIKTSPDHVLAIFRRDYDQDEKGRVIPRGITQPISQPRHLFNPKTTTYIISTLAAILIGTFFIRQVVSFRSAPSLEVIEPADEIETQSPIVVKGITDPEASATINNRPVSLDSSGQFSSEVNLNPGEHTLVITTTGRSGKSRSVQRIVVVTD
jgi:cytoskeletal protein RodZ